MEKITLDLTPEQAATVKTILMNVGGCPDKSARKFSDQVLHKLWELECDGKLDNVEVDFSIDPKFKKIYFLP